MSSVAQAMAIAGMTGANAAPAMSDAQVDRTAKAFESQFLSQMYAQMFDGVGSDDLSGGEESQEVYRSWMVDQYARLTSDAGGIGVAAYVKNELLRLQEVQTPAPATASVQS